MLQTLGESFIKNKRLNLDSVNGKVVLDTLNLWRGRKDLQEEQFMDISLSKRVGSLPCIVSHQGDLRFFLFCSE